MTVNNLQVNFYKWPQRLLNITFNVLFSVLCERLESVIHELSEHFEQGSRLKEKKLKCISKPKHYTKKINHLWKGPFRGALYYVNYLVFFYNKMSENIS